MRTINKVAAIGMLSVVGFIGCSDDDIVAGTVGRLGLELMVGDTQINEVTYTITNPDTTLLPTPITGTIDVTHVPGATFGAQIGGIPEGTGYTLTLTAEEAGEGGSTCSGSADFDVVAGTVTSVTMTLQCTGQVTTGSVRADATLNECAVVNNLTVLPTAVEVGYDIHVFAMGIDAEGDAITYAWTATGGSFADPSAADTMYHCTAPGPQTVTITIGDGDEACPIATASAEVMCIPLACGNGTVDEGEECDPPGTATCDAECQRVPVCGDTFIDDPEACDDGNTTAGDGCSATCTIEICGNGVVDPGEECDDANTANDDACVDPEGDLACQNAECGDSFVYVGVEACDDGNTVDGDGCSATCTVEA